VTALWFLPVGIVVVAVLVAVLATRALRGRGSALEARRAGFPTLHEAIEGVMHDLHRTDERLGERR
jgi:hypothetical protein